MKYLITEQQYDNAIDKFISYQFEPHKEKTLKKHPDSMLWVKYEIFDIISNMFSLDYEETQEVIEYWLKKHYNLKLTPWSGWNYRLNLG